MMCWAWIKHVLGLDMHERLRLSEQRKLDNAQAVDGAISAFRQVVKDVRR